MPKYFRVLLGAFPLFLCGSASQINAQALDFLEGFARGLNNGSAPETWGSIAYTGEGTFGSSWNYGSRNLALKNAIESCVAGGGARKSCSSEPLYANNSQCMSLAKRISPAGNVLLTNGSTALDLTSAINKAISYCAQRIRSGSGETCETITSICADGSHLASENMASADVDTEEMETADSNATQNNLEITTNNSFNETTNNFSSQTSSREWERSAQCERKFLEWNYAPTSFGSFALARNGACAWTLSKPSARDADFAALDACEKSSNDVCKITHRKQ